MKLLIASDAWHPQINGVVRSLKQMVSRADAYGVETAILSPADFRSLPLPGYREIRLALPRRDRLEACWDAFGPSHVHIATEGPVGLAALGIARDACRAEALCRSWDESARQFFGNILDAPAEIRPRAA